jgi:hypothetical protein
MKIWLLFRKTGERNRLCFCVLCDYTKRRARGIWDLKIVEWICLCGLRKTSGMHRHSLIGLIKTIEIVSDTLLIN